MFLAYVAVERRVRANFYSQQRQLRALADREGEESESPPVSEAGPAGREGLLGSVRGQGVGAGSEAVAVWSVDSVEPAPARTHTPPGSTAYGYDDTPARTHTPPGSTAYGFDDTVRGDDNARMPMWEGSGAYGSHDDDLMGSMDGSELRAHMQGPEGDGERHRDEAGDLSGEVFACVLCLVSVFCVIALSNEAILFVPLAFQVVNAHSNVHVNAAHMQYTLKHTFTQAITTFIFYTVDQDEQSQRALLQMAVVSMERPTPYTSRCPRAAQVCVSVCVCVCLSARVFLFCAHVLVHMCYCVQICAAFHVLLCVSLCLCVSVSFACAHYLLTCAYVSVCTCVCTCHCAYDLWKLDGATKPNTCAYRH